MELEEAEIINLAVNIFQNVGIKRYIGQIQALRHQDIYFEIYKIIFPDSMINIFKISESNLTTGQKIQKIIQEISSIIKLDLYHISGQAIAQGNRKDLTNWLQLLQALSNNCIAYQNYPGGGSAPDRDRQMYKQFEEDDYYTVQGVNGQFEKKHVYTDQKAEDSEQKDDSSERIQKNKPSAYGFHSKKEKKESFNQSQQGEDSLNRSFQKSSSSQNSGVLKPIPKKKANYKNQNSQKKVTFKLDDGKKEKKKGLQYKKIVQLRNNHNQVDKPTASSLNEPSNNLQKIKRENLQVIAYGQEKLKKSDSIKLLKKKKSFISKMHKIEEEMERKKINDETVKFQSWVQYKNHCSLRDANKIQQQNIQRTHYINKKIAQRQDFVNSLAGKQQAEETIKQIFRKQKQNQRRMRKVTQQQERKQALELMDLNFAAEVENMVMASIGQ